MDLFAHQAMEVDIIVTTALIPGKPAPKLITEGMVESMREGGVVVDLAAEQGGNCALTKPGEVVTRHGVHIVGYMDLPSRLPTQSSQLYATNLRHMLTDLTPEKNGQIDVNMEDEVIRGTTVVRQGEVTWPPPAPKMPATPPVKPEPAPAVVAVEEKKPMSKLTQAGIVGGIAAVLLAWLGSFAPPSFMQHFTVFVLACFVGWQVIWNVTHALHTPLMSVTNAISGIIVIGALLLVSSASWWVVLLAVVSILVATINVFGGFLVTHRMLKMFRRE